MQLLVLLGGDGGVVVPAEGLQGLLYESLSICGIQAAIAFVLLDQMEYARGEDLAFGQDILGHFPQLQVVDQLQAQQRGEDAERADVQRLLVHGTERGGVHRHPSTAEVVVAHRLHAHDRKKSRDGRQLLGRTYSDGPVAFMVQPFELPGPAQRLRHFWLLGHHLLVDFAHQRKQRAVQRHFLFVHERHGGRKLRTDAVGADEIMGGHRWIPG